MAEVMQEEVSELLGKYGLQHFKDFFEKLGVAQIEDLILAEDNITFLEEEGFKKIQMRAFKNMMKDEQVQSRRPHQVDSQPQSSPSGYGIQPLQGEHGSQPSSRSQSSSGSREFLWTKGERISEEGQNPWPPLRELETKFGCKILSTREGGNATLRSMTLVLDLLQRGELDCPEGLAVVLSESKDQYWLICRSDKLPEKEAIRGVSKRRYKVQEPGRDVAIKHVEYDIHEEYHTQGAEKYRTQGGIECDRPLMEGTEIEVSCDDGLTWRHAYTIMEHLQHIGAYSSPDSLATDNGTGYQ